MNRAIGAPVSDPALSKNRQIGRAVPSSPGDGAVRTPRPTSPGGSWSQLTSNFWRCSFSMNSPVSRRIGDRRSRSVAQRESKVRRILPPLLIGLLLSTHLTLAARPCHGRQFIGLSRFSTFMKGNGDSPGETAFVSPEIVSKIKWNELVVSWNADLPPGVVLKVEARAIFRQVGGR